MVGLKWLTDGHESTLTGEVSAGLQGLLVTGRHSYTDRRALKRHLIQFQVPNTAHKSSLTDRQERMNNSTFMHLRN